MAADGKITTKLWLVDRDRQGLLEGVVIEHKVTGHIRKPSLGNLSLSAGRFGVVNGHLGGGVVESGLCGSGDNSECLVVPSDRVDNVKTTLIVRVAITQMVGEQNEIGRWP